jgi:hypothetical protein
MKLKLAYPDLEYKYLANSLDSIAQHSDNEVLCEKAYIACMFLKHPERFSWITNDTYEQNNAFFQLLALKLEQQNQGVQNEFVSSDSLK